MVGKLILGELFKISDVKSLKKTIKEKAESISLVVNKTNEFDVPIGEFCSNPYECCYKNYCWNVFP